MNSIFFSSARFRPVVWTLIGSRERNDPWGEIELTCDAVGPHGERMQIPAFWDGESVWRFRISLPIIGTWTLTSSCSDTSDTGLHGAVTHVEVTDIDAGEQSVLFRQGPVSLSPDRSYFMHADGVPFYWLADTWWMLATERVSWPEGFQVLTNFRHEQGFTAIQIVVGFQPDLAPFDGRDANAGGFPWLEGYERINPKYFAEVDKRIEYLVETGILPCILGAWGYHLLFMGQERMISHWKYLVARYGAWPVVWCLAGEGAMGYYLSQDRPSDSAQLRQLWPRIAREVRAFDPWHRPITLHPRRHSWDDTADPGTLDFHMTQAGHNYKAAEVSLDALAIGRARFPGMAIVNAEPPYEGHGGSNREDLQRYSFWSSMLSGATGFTYGAAGLFQANDRDRPAGKRPNGGAFDRYFWDDAMKFPGAEQIAKGFALLRGLDLHRFTLHPEWASVELRSPRETYHLSVAPFAAGIPHQVRLIYLPLRWGQWDGPLVHHLEPGVTYEASYLEPDTLQHHPLGAISGDKNEQWKAPTLPHMFDWLLLLKAASQI